MLTIKFTRIVSCLLLTIFFNSATFAWGPKGHTIVGEIGMYFLKDDVRKNVEKYLGTMTVAQASNWMDSLRSNADYDFMKPWHYINIPNGKNYTPSTDENIVNRLIITFNELRHKKTLCDDQIKTDLLVLFHLIGDLHQPLHNGYDDDLGGNKLQIQFLSTKANLHQFWDENLVDNENVTMEACLKLLGANTPEQYDTIKGIHFASWMSESRSLLNTVYDYKGFQLDKQYVQRSTDMVKRQLLIAGIRLAAVLNKLFYSPAPDINTASLTSKYKNGIDASQALNYVGKKVTVCSRTYGIKSTDKVSFINLGAKFPDTPLTVVIFAKDRKNFKGDIEELFSDKNVCVTGKVIEYNKKAEIIITGPEDILIIQ